jgi:hypothetical protein
MASITQRILNFRSSDFPVTNLQFDGVAALAAGVSSYFQKTEGFFAGLQTFTALSFADRVISKAGGARFKLPITGQESLLQGIVTGIFSAIVEEGMYSGVLLTDQKSIGFAALRIATSFAIAMTASRSIRHANPNQQDLFDAIYGLGWAVCREIIVQKASPLTATIVMLVSNSLMFGIIERGKFSRDPLQNYKFFSSVVFRGICDLSAMNMQTLKRNSFVVPLTAHIIFNISRSLKS